MAQAAAGAVRCVAGRRARIFPDGAPDHSHRRDAVVRDRGGERPARYLVVGRRGSADDRSADRQIDAPRAPVVPLDRRRRWTRSVAGLSWEPAGTEWSDYAENTSYGDRATADKVRLGGRHPAPGGRGAVSGSDGVQRPVAGDRAVDVLDAGESLLEAADGVQHVGHEQAVHDEARRVLRLDRLLAERLREVVRSAEHLLVDRNGAHDLDQLHDRHGIEEVQPDESIGTTGRRGHVGCHRAGALWVQVAEKERQGDDRFFYRELVFFQEEQIDAWTRDFTLTVNEMIQDRPTIYRTIPFKGCGDCWFRDICQSKHSGGDVDYILDARYTVGTYGTVEEVRGIEPTTITSVDELKEFLANV